MNLFILNRLPVLAARENCDSHVRKIILEAVEMMGYSFDEGEFKPWPWLHDRGRHYTRPMSLWVRENRKNFDWTLQHAYALCDEFVYRSSHKRQHACRAYLDWISANLPIHNLPDEPQTDWPRCFGKYREIVGVTDDAVYDYRRYYMLAKRHISKWTNRPIPDWYK
jgi:hypothetical protein